MSVKLTNNTAILAQFAAFQAEVAVAQQGLTPAPAATSQPSNQNQFVTGGNNAPIHRAE